jgi:hypothetical protein
MEGFGCVRLWRGALCATSGAGPKVEVISLVAQVPLGSGIPEAHDAESWTRHKLGLT